MRTRSRLSRQIENNSKKNIVVSLVGIIVILFILVKFGLPAMANISGFIAGNTNDDKDINKNSNTFVAAPVLGGQPDATKSAQITISGSAFTKQIISLYVNGEIVDKTEVDDKNKFTFQNVTLKQGDNKIQAKARLGNNVSTFSNTIDINYANKNPILIIDFPSDGQNYKKEDNQAQIKGKTDTGNKVTVNSFWAIVDGEGSFSYSLPLLQGDNTIKIVATDQAGNTTEAEKKVIYSP